MPMQRGLILADTKFEFGLTAKGIVLADEVLRPTRLASGPAKVTTPGLRNHHSTNSLCATIWKPWVGISSRPRLSFQPTWFARLRKNMSRLYIC